MTAHIRMRTYAIVFATLLVLTALTVMIAFVHLGRVNDVVALTIAVTKALLVLIYFMHLRHSPALVRLSLAAGVFWLLIMIVLTMSDFVTRDMLPVPGVRAPTTVERANPNVSSDQPGPG
jgi:cytochrome c oxidase subunit IV